MVSIIKYLFESETITAVGKKLYDLTHDPESGVSIGGKLLKTKRAVGLEDTENRFELAKQVSKGRETNPEVVKQWAPFLKKRK